jgi:outer membrane protein assembly factor BamA
LNLAEIGAAFVHDSAQFGPTGPVSGQRYRFEITPTFGSLTFANVLMDYRRYLRPVRPLTIAARALHFGRYGAHADDRRLPQLFAGHPSLVRGYEVDLYSGGRCILDTCPAADPLAGSKLLVANLELRAPLLFWKRENPYGPIPAELALFFDAGLAWRDHDRPRFLGGSRDWVRSWGAALRFNLFGFAIGEIDYVRPLDRDGPSALWRFRISPGF